VSVNDCSPGDTFHGEITGDRISAVRELCDPGMCRFSRLDMHTPFAEANCSRRLEQLRDVGV
jgi:hypothetical protein